MEKAITLIVLCVVISIIVLNGAILVICSIKGQIVPDALSIESLICIVALPQLIHIFNKKTE